GCSECGLPLGALVVTSRPRPDSVAVSSSIVVTASRTAHETVSISCLGAGGVTAQPGTVPRAQADNSVSSRPVRSVRRLDVRESVMQDLQRDGPAESSG